MQGQQLSDPIRKERQQNPSDMEVRAEQPIPGVEPDAKVVGAAVTLWVGHRGAGTSSRLPPR